MQHLKNFVKHASNAVLGPVFTSAGVSSGSRRHSQRFRNDVPDRGRLRPPRVSEDDLFLLSDAGFLLVAAAARLVHRDRRDRNRHGRDGQSDGEAQGFHAHSQFRGTLSAPRFPILSCF